MSEILSNVITLIALYILIALFIKLAIYPIGYFQIKYYRKRYSKRDIQEFILKFCHGCFCLSTYNPSQDMAYNVYDQKPLTKEQLKILIGKLLDDKIIRLFSYHGQNSYCIISDRKSALLKKLIREKG